MSVVATLPIVPNAPAPATRAPTLSAEAVADLHHAGVFWTQKRIRHEEAHRAYLAAFHDPSMSVSEHVRLLDAVRFAADERRRAKAHFFEVMADAVRQGTTR